MQSEKVYRNGRPNLACVVGRFSLYIVVLLATPMSLESPAAARAQGVGLKGQFPKLIYYNRVTKGGHFAAWEQPEIYTQEIRAAFKSQR